MYYNKNISSFLLDETSSNLYKLLEKSVTATTSKTIALSGGLDSTILAYLLQNRNPHAYVVISQDFLATDLTYCQLAAKRFNLKLKIVKVSTEELFSGIEECIKILKNFNDIEIRNSVVLYLVMKAIKDDGFNSVIIGDGADELFAGYNFFLKKTQQELDKDLARIWEIMHFPSIKIGEFFGIRVELPYLEKEFMAFAKKIPSSMKVGEKGGKRYGKLILRKTFEEKIPVNITWREKSPMQDGAGTSGLTELFENLIPNESFFSKKETILDSERVTIRTKESLYYYQIYRKHYDLPSKLHSSHNTCPFCEYALEENNKFCRMCGAYPI